MFGAQTDFLKGFEEFFRNRHPQKETSLASAQMEVCTEESVFPRSSENDPVLAHRGRSLARALGCHGIERSLSVKWSARLITTAGLANLHLKQITLNIRLKDISEAEVERTFLHELAHLIAHERADNRRIKAHGAEWRRACADLGIPGESARHNLPFKRRKLAVRYHYLCTHCGKSIARVRKIRYPAACADCCNSLNRGRFDRRFLLREAPSAPGSHYE